MNATAIAFTLSDEAVEVIAARVAEILAERLPADSDASPYLTVSEAADYLRAKPQRIYDLLSAHKLTRHHDGSRVLVSRAELEDYLRGRAERT